MLSAGTPHKSCLQLNTCRELTRQSASSSQCDFTRGQCHVIRVPVSRCWKPRRPLCQAEPLCSDMLRVLSRVENLPATPGKRAMFDTRLQRSLPGVGIFLKVLSGVGHRHPSVDPWAFP